VPLVVVLVVIPVVVLPVLVATVSCLAIRRSFVVEDVVRFPRPSHPISHSHFVRLPTSDHLERDLLLWHQVAPLGHCLRFVVLASL
jgi:hypothetical protein